jgi:hypothetical protein
MRKAVLLFVVLAMFGLSACSNDTEVHDLQRQVAELQQQVQELNGTNAALANRLKSERDTEKGLRDCVSNLAYLAHGMRDVLRFIESPNSLIGSGVPGFGCRDVLTDGQVKSLQAAVQYVNSQQKAAQKQHFAAVAPPSDSSSSTVSAICNDGTSSYSQHAQGTCSYHGGVDHWVNYPG